MEDRIYEWELVDKILFSALLSVVKSGQEEVTYRELIEANYTSTPYLLSVYLKRLVRKCYLSSLTERLQGGDIKFRLEEPTDESVSTALLDYLSKVKFGVKYYRQVYCEVLHQVMTDECMHFLFQELKDCRVCIDSNLAPPQSISDLLASYSMQKVCTLLKLAVKDVLIGDGRAKCHAMNDMKLVDEICKTASSMSHRYSQLCTHLEKYERDAAYKRSAVSYLLTEVVSKIGPGYYQDDELWINAFSGPFDLTTLFPDTSPYDVSMVTKC